MLSVCWLTWLHALALPPSILSSSPSPLTVDHGNVIMHGSISQDGYHDQNKVNNYLFHVVEPLSASLVLPGLFPVV